jgi:hypothetical protein
LLYNSNGLLVLHLLGLEGAFFQIMLKTLVVDEIFENVFDSINRHVVYFRHVDQQQVHHPVVVGF